MESFLFIIAVITTIIFLGLIVVAVGSFFGWLLALIGNDNHHIDNIQ
jgi:hypothetical protein